MAKEADSVPLNILDLPYELLMLIFSKCDTRSLCRLTQTCHKFKGIIEKESSVWENISKSVWVANQVSERMRARCTKILSNRDKVKTSVMWRKGLSSGKGQFKLYDRYIPWIQIEDNWLWYSKGSTLVRWSRKYHGTVFSSRKEVTYHERDITRFVILPNYVISAGRDNRICVIDKATAMILCDVQNVHVEEVTCLDSSCNVLVSASRDKTVKVFTQLPDLQLMNTLVCFDHIWDISLIADRFFLIGCAAWETDVHPLQLFDIERCSPICSLGPQPRKGAGISCICTESPNEVYSGGYDSAVRLWDLRTPNLDVLHWENPFDYSILSLATDHQNTVFSGSQRDVLVCMYDKRWAKMMQYCYMGLGNSPVYSLAFDALTIFAALDKRIFWISHDRLLLSF